MTKPRITEADYRRALEGGARYERDPFRVTSVLYNAATDQIELTFADDTRVLLNRHRVTELAGLAKSELHEVSLTPGGTGLELVRADVHVSVEGLLESLLPKRGVMRAPSGSGRRTNRSVGKS